MTADSPNEQIHFAGAIEQLREGFSKMTTKVHDNPELARHLNDRTLLTLTAWTEGEDHPAIAAECKRRLAEYQARERRFAAFGDQLDLVADLPPDTPWTEARVVLAARTRKS